MDRFLIVRFGSIGNTLVSIPAIRALRKAYPSSYLAMIVSPGIEDLLSDIKWIDELIVYDMHNIHKSLFAYIKFIQKLRKRHFNVAIMFKRFLRSELIGFLSGAKRRIGFETNGKSHFLTDRMPYVEGMNIVALNMMLLNPLGISDDDLSIKLDISDCNKDDIVVTATQTKLNKYHTYAVVHPGGKTVQGTGLNINQYSQIINKLEKEYALFCFIIGDHSELNTIQEILKLTNSTMTFAVTGLSLKKIGCLIKHATVFIGNDSGPSHIANAVGTPGIIIYPPILNLKDHLKKWKPLGEDYKAIYPPVECENCTEFPCNDSLKTKCIEKIDIGSVLHYIGQILNKR